MADLARALEDRLDILVKGRRRVLRQDYWLHMYGKPDWHGEETRRIKADIRKRYYPDTDDWRQMVLFRSRQIIKQALAGLTGT